MNDLDLSLFSDADLDALEKGDLSALSEEGLSILETRQSIISKGPKTRYRPRSLPPGEVTEAKPAQTRLPTLPREPKIRTDVSPGGGTSALLGMLGGFPRMAAGVTSIFGENELSRQLKELEAGLRERAPVKETYDVTKYAAEVIPAATTAKVLSKVPMASRTAQQLLQAAGQAGTAAAVEPEDRAEAATVAGGVGLIPVGTKTLGVVTEKVNEVLTGGKPDVVRDQLARIAEQLGFKIQAGQVSRTAPVSTPGAGEAAVTNQDLANRWASAPTGETTDKITGTFISDRKSALGADYDSIFQNRQFAITGPDIRAFENVLDLEDSISPAHVPKVKEMAKSILKNYDEMSAKIARSGTKMPAEEGVDAFPFTIAGEGLQRLRNKLRLAASSATDRSAAFEINKLVDQIDEIVKGTDPKLYEKLIDTNRKYRATSTLETLEKKGDIPAGDVSLERLGREVSDDKFNPLFPIGKIGQELGIRGVWEPEVSGLMRGAAGEARQLIRPGMTRIILNRIAMYPRSQAARNLQRKIMDAEATGGLGNLSLSAEELAILNPIMQSIAEEPPEEKAKGGVVYSEKERQLLDRYANGGSVTRPTLPADRLAGYKQPGEGEEDRLIRFFEAAARELPDAIKQNVTSNADLASKYLKFKFGMMSPEEAMRVAKMLPNSLKALAANAVQTVKEAPRAIAEATPESAGKFTGQVLAGELTDPLRIARAADAVTQPVKQKIFIGEKAKTWNAEAAKQAQELENQGVSPEKIWQETGTFRSPDGKWRQEISDLPATWKGNKIDAPVSYHLEHPALYEAYPELSSGESFIQPRPGQKGSYQFVENQNPSEILKVGTDNPRSIALHELQHAIQRREGFEPGGRPFSETGGTDLTKSVNLINEFSTKFDRLRELKRQLPRDQQPKGSKLIGWAYREFDIDDLFDDIEDNVKNPKIRKEMLDILEELDVKRENLFGIRTGAMEQELQLRNYQRLAGEAEARAVQQRAGYTPSMLKKRLPTFDYDVPLNELILKEKK